MNLPYLHYKIHHMVFIVLLLLLAKKGLGQQTNFSQTFSPTDDFVKQPEKAYRDGLCLNGKWQFMPVENAEKLPLVKIKTPDLPSNPVWDSTPVKVPSPWNINSFARGDGSGGDYSTYPSYPKKWENIRAGWLRRSVPYKKEWKGKRLILHFDAVGGFTQVYVNRKKVAENFEVFLPFEVDVTDEIKDSPDNELILWVADAQLFNQPGKFGRRIHVAGSFWGQHAIGIWQDVNLIVKPSINIESTFIKPSLKNDELTIETTVTNHTGKVSDVSISGQISPWLNMAGKDVLAAPEPKWKLESAVISVPESKIRVNPNSQVVVSLKVKVSGRLKQWDTENPNLYGLVLSARSGNKDIDKQYTRFGWREFTLNGSELFLNGKPIVLKTDSWHFMGIPQMTRRYAWAWYKLLKDSRSNSVRLHAQPYPQFYIDMADEMGICVLDETGLWASDGGPKIDAEAYWANSSEHLRRLILRDRNSPSVFGWSVCNENLPVVTGVFHAPDSLVKRQVTEIDKWIAIAQQLDPTRAWVSGDGETRLPIQSPVIVGHYGSEESFRGLSQKGKPWGIGEAGMAYYGTPLQASVYNGNRSYESQQGRMEAIGYEATGLINLFKKYHAAYQSIFNIVWYGVKPLELGLADTTRAPKASDGIFFGPYKENQPGVQPERLGPYSTTLNPGYDPRLPLYKTWPLFDEVKRSFSTPELIPQTEKNIQSPAPNRPFQKHAVILLSADPDSALFKLLTGIGISLSDKILPKSQHLLIIDGLHAPSDASSTALQKTVAQNGGRTLVWGINSQNLAAVNKYLPQPLALTDRRATSFIPSTKDVAIDGLSNADFYFSEISEKPMISNGLTGEFVKHGTVLLAASNTDWKTWNKRAEYLKTAAVLRSEREYKPVGNALVSNNSVKGNIYVLAIDPFMLTNTSISVARKILVNLGVDFNGKASQDLPALNSEGKLVNALMLASFNIAGKTDAEIGKINLLNNLKPEDYLAGKRVENHFWEKANAPEGIFDFSKFHFDGPTVNSIAYLSFWIYSPRSLSNLLLEPDMPRLDMYVGADDGFQVYLNNNLLKESINAGGLSGNGQAIKALSLEKGWNHFIIKAIQKAGAWKLSVRFDSDKKSFLNEIKTQTIH